MKIDQGTARALNRRLILNLLRERGALSRAEIAAAVGLSGATVTFAVGDLIEEGLLVEGQPSKGATGRRPISVEINYSGLLAVGLKVMVGSVECVLTDLSTTPLLTRTFSLPDQAPEVWASAVMRLTPLLSHRSRRFAIARQKEIDGDRKHGNHARCNAQ